MAKLGSRRIFAPQFKLQVLDSYRADADCRGNQRATARKYGIHRRQIQKWLQAEAALRGLVTQVASQSGPVDLSLPKLAELAELAKPGYEAEPVRCLRLFRPFLPERNFELVALPARALAAVS